MAKRRSAYQLTHDNWDEEDETEEKGSFTPVAQNVLQTRVIKKAKRNLEEDGDTSEKEKPVTPFAAFAGFASQALKPVFTIQNKEVNKVTDSASESSVISTDKSEEKSSRPATKSECDEAQKTDDNLQYFRQLRALNESVLTWIQLHIAKNPCSDFTPVFDDYKKHLKKLEDGYFIKKCASGGDSASSNSAIFKIPEKMLSKMNTESFKKSGFFASDKSSCADPELIDPRMLYGANFASNTTNTSTFSFGMKLTPTASSPGSNLGPTASHSVNPTDENETNSDDTDETPKFSFGVPQKNSSEKSELERKPFSFGVSSFLAGNNNSQVAEAKSEKNEDEPPQNEFQPVVEDDAFYSKRCKLYYKKGDQFIEKGVGMLYLKPLEQKTQLLVRADTNLGNILLNILLSASLPMSRTGKNNVLIVCVPNPPLDANKPDVNEAIPMLLKVKTKEDADELLENLNKHKS